MVPVLFMCLYVTRESLTFQFPLLMRSTTSDLCPHYLQVATAQDSDPASVEFKVPVRPAGQEAEERLDNADHDLNRSAQATAEAMASIDEDKEVGNSIGW